VYRIYRELELNLRIKPKKRLVREKPEPLSVPTNENTNGLLRQYFPIGTSLKGYSQYYLDSISSKLNDRLRKTLKYHTPHDMLDMVLL